MKQKPRRLDLRDALSRIEMTPMRVELLAMLSDAFNRYLEDHKWHKLSVANPPGNYTFCGERCHVNQPSHTDGYGMCVTSPYTTGAYLAKLLEQYYPVVKQYGRVVHVEVIPPASPGVVRSALITTGQPASQSQQPMVHE